MYVCIVGDSVMIICLYWINLRWFRYWFMTEGCLPYLLSLLKGSTVCWYCPFILLSLLKHTAEQTRSKHQLLLLELAVNMFVFSNRF